MLELLQFILSKPSKFYGTLALIIVIGIIIYDIVAAICNTVARIKCVKYYTKTIEKLSDIGDKDLIEKLIVD